MLLNITRLPQVIKATGRGRSSLYNDIHLGVFTKPIAIGARSVGWPSHEVTAINAARIAGKSDDEIRQLVKDLEAARQSATKGGLL